MKVKSLIIIFFMVSYFVSTAQSTEEKAVADAVEELRKAMVDADKGTLQNIAADELSYGHSSGKIEDKSAFVEAITNGQSDFKSITLSEQTIKVRDNVAIVRHKLFAETNDGGKPGTANIGVMLIWQKQKDEWKLIARQAFKLNL